MNFEPNYPRASGPKGREAPRGQAAPPASPASSRIEGLIVVGCLAAWLAVAPPLAAQIGDHLDKPGEVQRPLIPPDQIPPAPALSPAEALKTLALPPGYQLEIAAADPLVQDPVTMAFGPDGRMWVVEMRGYMPDLDGTGEDAPIGRVVVLTDRDGDGRYDESQVFIDQLVLPRAIALVGDGVLVGAPPELAFWRDTDGDGRADRKEIVATDYGVKVDPQRPQLANPERAPNGLLWAFDNWIYSAAYTKKFRYAGGAWETGNTDFRGQWGLGEDHWGRLVYGSNSDGLRIDVIHSDYLRRNRHYPRLAGANVNAAENQFVWPARVTPGINRGYRPEMLRNGRLKEFTAACGWWVYHGDLMPELAGSVFVAEPSANLVRRFELTSEDGRPRGRNPHVRDEFMTSTDERFRPVNFATGPDGALYVVDFHRGVVEHRISLTSYLREQSEARNLVGPRHLGRIYRIVPAGGPAPRATKLAPLTNAQWVEKLAHPNGWWRQTAQRILVERRDPALVPAIRQLARAAGTVAGRVQALWTLEGIGALDRETVEVALAARDPVVRVHALRLGERFLEGDSREDLVARVLPLTRDVSPEVQLQAVLTLGRVRDPDIDFALAEAARANPRTAFLREALYSGLEDRELALLERLIAAWPSEDAGANDLLTGLVRGVAGARQLPGINRVFALAGASAASGATARAGALLEGLRPVAGSSRAPLQLGQQPEGWRNLAENPATRARLAQLGAFFVWPGQPGAAAAAVDPLTPAQQARFHAGRSLFPTVCAACHQPDGRGLDGLAPPLRDSEWILGPAERAVRIVLHGVRGPITVLGRTHTGDMPAFGALNDEQVASILTYLRREWGHAAPAIEVEQVAAIRAATAGRADAWSADELKQIR